MMLTDVLDFPFDYPKTCLAIIIGLMVLLVVSIVKNDIKQQAEWEKFCKEHHCRIVEVDNGGVDMGIGTMVGSNGNVSTGVMPILRSKRVCYECDDGKRYWRDK